MQTTYIGKRAEQVAAEHLVQLGYHIIDRNWRRRECEIDIVARKEKTMYMVEVKYRQTNVAGSGLDYITPQKLKQMGYAARRWIAENRWSGESVLAAIEVAGQDFKVSEFIDCIEDY